MTFSPGYPHFSHLMEALGRKLTFAAFVLDKPEDRLWHAEDDTWWHNPNGLDNPTLKAADMPEPLKQKLATFDGLLAACEVALATCDLTMASRKQMQAVVSKAQAEERLRREGQEPKQGG